MATKTLRTNVNQAVQDFDNIKQAIIDKGVEIPNGTPTSEYATKIGDIQGGGGGLDTSEVTTFMYFDYGNRFSQEELNKLNTSKGTDFSGMFYNCNKLTSVPQLDTSKGTSFGNMFSSCSKLTTIPPLDTSNGTSFSYMFDKCTGLTTIPQLSTSNGTNFQNMFSSCNKLTTIPPLDTSNGTSFSYMFQNCAGLTTLELTSFVASSGMFSSCSALENLTVTGTITVNSNNLNLSNSPLTVDSLMSVINALADNTGKTAYKITLGATNLAKLTEEQKQIAIDKNYTLA